MTIRTVGQLIDALTAYPPWRDVVVEVTVGGDLVTDVVDLEPLDEVIVGSGGATAVRLRPAPDEYDVRNLIDDGLAYREDLDVAPYRVLERRPDLWRILDRRTGMVDVVAFGEHSYAIGTLAEHAAPGLESGLILRLRQRAAQEERERHCHAGNAGPCLADDCPIAGQRPRPCPGAPGPQHPATTRARY